MVPPHGAPQGLPEAHHEEPAIGQVSERIVQCLVMQALLQGLALGKVVENPLPVEGFARFVPYQHRLLTHPHHRVVLGQQAVLLPERLAASRFEALVGGKDPLTVAWVETLGPQLLGLPLLGGVAEHLLYVRAGVERGVWVVYRVYIGDGRYLLYHGTVALLRIPERLLGMLTHRYVYLYPEPVERLPLLVPHQRRLVPDPHQMPILGELAVLHHERITSLVRAPVLGQDPLPVVGVQDLYPEVWAGGAFLGGVAHHVRNPGTNVDRLAVAAYLPDIGDYRYPLDQCTIPLLGFLALRDVSGGDHHASHMRIV